MMVKSEILQRITASASFGSAGLFAGLTMAEVELMLRIVVGALSAISLLIHIVITIRKERKRGKK